MDVIIILMSIVGMLIGILLLRDFRIYKKIIIVISIDLFLYLFHAPIIYISIILVNNIDENINVNLYYWIAMGMFLSFSVLAPMYAYSINRYKKNKKISDFILSLLATTIIFIMLLCVFIICANRIRDLCF